VAANADAPRLGSKAQSGSLEESAPEFGLFAGFMQPLCGCRTVLIVMIADCGGENVMEGVNRILKFQVARLAANHLILAGDGGQSS